MAEGSAERGRSSSGKTIGWTETLDWETVEESCATREILFVCQVVNPGLSGEILSVGPGHLGFAPACTREMVSFSSVNASIGTISYHW